jgi:hypothetical protein
MLLHKRHAAHSASASPFIRISQRQHWAD